MIDDEATLKFGLLMESAEAHQKLAETHLERLRAHTQGLDEVVRDEIRRTLNEELRMLTAESRQAAETLRRIKCGAGARGALWSALLGILCCGVPLAIANWNSPSESEIDALRARRDDLSMNIAKLEAQGGRIDWRRCGASGRLCVRVDRKARVFGEKADFYVLNGY